VTAVFLQLVASTMIDLFCPNRMRGDLWLCFLFLKALHAQKQMMNGFGTGASSCIIAPWITLLLTSISCAQRIFTSDLQMAVFDAAAHFIMS
jgi:hypothetical protein